MSPKRCIWILLPKERGSWILLAVFSLMFALAIGPGLKSPKGFLLMLAVAASGSALLFLPQRALDAWEALPVFGRGTLLAVGAYAVVITIGNFHELYSIRLWLDFLFLRAGTPFTSIHAVALAGAVFAYSTQRYDNPSAMPEDSERVLDGPILLSETEARARLSAEFFEQRNQPQIAWGCMTRPISTGTEHFCIVGASGAGKSKMLQFTMESVLPLIVPGSNKRAVVYDAKREIYPILRGMNLHEERIHILNPFDKRCVAWDIARDVSDAATAVEIGSLLVPDRAEVQPFFPEAARALLGGAMEALNHCAPGKWTFRDVILTLRRAETTRIILGNCPQTSYLVAKFLKDGDTYASISATLENVLRRLGLVAAAWDRAETNFTFQDWIKGEGILVLGNTLTHESIIKQINAALVHRMFQVILDQPDAGQQNPPSQSWIFLDELRVSGIKNYLPDFLVQARSKGGCVVIGFQDIPGLYSSFGDKNLADEIIGECSNKAFLKCEHVTAQTAMEYFDHQEIEITRYSPSWSESFTSSGSSSSRTVGSGVSVSRTIHKRPVVLSSKLKGLPKASPRNGIKGYFIDSHLEKDSYVAVMSGEKVDTLAPRLDDVPDFIKRPASDFELRKWEFEDLKRLRLTNHAKALMNEETNTQPEKQGPISLSNT